LVESRTNARWDGGIPRAAILIHRFQGNRSYIMAGTSGQLDLTQGDAFQLGSETFEYAPYCRVEVVATDAAADIAEVHLAYRGARQLIERQPFRRLRPEELPGGVTWPLDFPPPPWDPLVADIVGQLQILSASEALPQPWTRDAVKRDSLERIAADVETALQDLKPFRVPAPPFEREGSPGIPESGRDG
jgi:hypothetical protein